MFRDCMDYKTKTYIIVLNEHVNIYAVKPKVCKKTWQLVLVRILTNLSRIILKKFKVEIVTFRGIHNM